MDTTLFIVIKMKIELKQQHTDLGTPIIAIYYIDAHCYFSALLFYLRSFYF